MMAQSKVSELAKVSAMGMIGTAIEDFDFIAAGLASSIAWPYVFFPKGNFAADLLASLGAFLVSFVARPFGAFLFGHYGDRLGRKSSLVFTLLTMGVGVLIIAIVPGYAVLGLAAPILLFHCENTSGTRLWRRMGKCHYLGCGARVHFQMESFMG